MPKVQRTKTLAQLDAELESLMREYVNRWIEGCGSTGEMKDRAKVIERQAGYFLLRDIRLFAETGKYPKWAQEAQEEAPHANLP